MSPWIKRAEDRARREVFWWGFTAGAWVSIWVAGALWMASRGSALAVVLGLIMASKPLMVWALVKCEEKYGEEIARAIDRSQERQARFLKTRFGRIVNLVLTALTIAGVIAFFATRLGK
jgi:peptidoglycan/LPS O-acetylase OafA/YrhL